MIKETEPPKDRLPSKSMPMALSDLTDQILNDIVSIYNQVAQSPLAQEFVESSDSSRKLKYVQEMLNYGNAAEWRFGSKLSRDTKLFVWQSGWSDKGDLICFSFDPNSLVSDPENKLTTQLTDITQSFRTQVNQYLSDHNLVVT